ncbi:MAG: hypothetical protein IJY27_06235 [Clostridia bacterium]|nr:hypothetical protein [Clostridia bacterium]
MALTDDREQLIRDTTDFLRQYRYGFKLLAANKYERDYFAADLPEDGLYCTDDEAYVKAKMFEVKRFVTSLPPDDRKLFLYYHYIHGETVEKCGELLNISRRSAFRLKRRALEYAALKYKRYLSDTEINGVLCRE